MFTGTINITADSIIGKNNYNGEKLTHLLRWGDAAHAEGVCDVDNEHFITYTIWVASRDTG